MSLMGLSSVTSLASLTFSQFTVLRRGLSTGGKGWDIQAGLSLLSVHRLTASGCVSGYRTILNRPWMRDGDLPPTLTEHVQTTKWSTEVHTHTWNKFTCCSMVQILSSFHMLKHKPDLYGVVFLSHFWVSSKPFEQRKMFSTFYIL